jgi:DNA-3-methyladenine glycosylase II
MNGSGSRHQATAMAGPEEAASLAIHQQGPFDLPLSLAAAASFLPSLGLVPTVLRQAVRVNGVATVVEIHQPAKTNSLIRVSAAPAVDRIGLRELAKWLISADLDLRAFYRLAAEHPVLGAAIEALHGLKPLRPASLFEMLVIAITEQQLSLAAAFRIRSRLVSRFGGPIADLWLFPEPEALAEAQLIDLRACGLSERKAEYIRSLARHVVDGDLRLDNLKQQSDAEVRENLLRYRGFGEWSIQYILVRGLGRPDALPSDDVGLRRVLGMYFASGQRLSAQQLEESLSPFRRFRGLAAFYLSVHWRLCRAARAIPA